MDWRFNSIWFDKIDKNLFYSKDFKENRLMSENQETLQSEYAILWHLNENKISELEKFENLKYLQLNLSNIKNFSFVKKIKSINRLHLEHCVKLEDDFGISEAKKSLQSLHIGISKKFQFTDELLKLKKLRVLTLNDCGEIENLDFLQSFPNLIDFRFVNTNIKNGDLTPILEHKSIKNVGFLNKRHYNIKDLEMFKLLEEKNVPFEKIYEYKGGFETFRYNYE